MAPLLVLLGLTGPLVAALTYATFCYISPFGRCVACRLTPADWCCRRCDGTGRRIRVGIRVWQAWRRTWRDAHRAYPTTTTPDTSTSPPNPTGTAPTGTAPTGASPTSSTDLGSTSSEGSTY